MSNKYGKTDPWLRVTPPLNTINKYFSPIRFELTSNIELLKMATLTYSIIQYVYLNIAFIHL